MKLICLSLLILALILTLTLRQRKFFSSLVVDRISKIFFLTIIFDGLVTISGQSASYWLDYTKASEGNFIGRFFLIFHPLSFIFALIIYGLFSAYFLTRVNKPIITYFFFLFLILNHLNGIFSWTLNFSWPWLSWAYKYYSSPESFVIAFILSVLYFYFLKDLIPKFRKIGFLID